MMQHVGLVGFKGTEKWGITARLDPCLQNDEGHTFVRRLLTARLAETIGEENAAKAEWFAAAELLE